MEYVMAVICFLIGLVVGSFLNVVIYRLPRKESLVRPGSHCPSCGHPVRWYHNVPLVSWVLLRGKCGDCGERISVRYPLVESMTGVGFLLAFVCLGFEWRLLIACAFIAAMIAVAFIDFDHMIIPDKIVLPGALIGLAASVAVSPSDWWKYLAAALGAALFLFILAMIWAGGMGPGDIKMALFMGAVLGVSVIVALFIAFLVGALVGVALIVAKKRSRKDKIPFGPFLAFGSVVAVLVGQDIVSLYSGLYA